MKQTSTRTSSAKSVKLSKKTLEAYRKRDTQLDHDADAPQLPPEFWQRAKVGKYYRPIKSQISLRIDNEVLDWLKSKGKGHLSRINEILRDRMLNERR